MYALLNAYTGVWETSNTVRAGDSLTENAGHLFLSGDLIISLAICLALAIGCAMWISFRRPAYKSRRSRKIGKSPLSKLRDSLGGMF